MLVVQTRTQVQGIPAQVRTWVRALVRKLRKRFQGKDNGEQVMQDWETMIAERVAAHGVVVTCREQDPRRRNRQAYDRRHDKTPKRIAQHKAWAKSPAGKKSMRKRGARYRATEKGRLNSLKKSRAYFERHKDDPAWREHRRQVQKAWKRRKREEKEKQAA